MPTDNKPTRRLVRGPHIYEGAGGILYAYQPDGRRRTSLGTRDRKEAERAFRDLLAGVARGVGAGAPRRESTLIDLFTAYLAAPHGWTKQTHRTARNRLAAFCEWVAARGAVFPADVTPVLLDEWLTARRKVTVHRTINRDLRAVRLMFAWASSADRDDAAPNAAVAERGYFREVRRDARHVVPDPVEMRRVFDAVDALDAEEKAEREAARKTKPYLGREPRYGARAALEAAYVTGLRVDELRRVQPWDLRDGTIYCTPEEGAADVAEPGKAYRERSIPLAPAAREVMVRFFRWTGTRKRTFSESWLVKRLGEACERARVPRCGLHDLRRAFCTEQVRAGVRIVIVSGWLGHADVATTERYIATYRSDRDVVAAVPGGETVIAAPALPNTLEVRGASLGNTVPRGEQSEGGGMRKGQESRSYPSDLNRRPAVYEGASTGRKEARTLAAVRSTSQGVGSAEAQARNDARRRGGRS
jgi:site-specific recombinase XerD